MKRRFFLLYLLFFFSFAALLFRLFDLTVAQGSYYRQLADGQRVRLRRIIAARGVIFDRQGQSLVSNIPVFKKCHPQEAKCELVTREEALSLEAAGLDADLVIEVGREYPFGEMMAHLLGYLGEATEEEVKKGSFTLGSLLGRTGIEEEDEALLRGQNGAELVEVDTHGLTVRKIGKKEPVAGRDIFLSIDQNLQKVAYEAIKSQRGAVVATEAKTGQVLVLVSSPSFDPNVLTEEVLVNPEKPMFNRAIGGAYPPGSTFKIVTSAAALEEGKIDAQTRIEDQGQIVIGQYRYANWFFTKYGRTEGVIGLTRAIARSTDTFFYKVGEMVGPFKMVEWGGRFGLGSLSGIDLPGEIAGFLPKPQEGYWFLGNTYHLSIGQGALGLTPLQVNQMMGVIASGGKWCKPQIKAREREGERARGECVDVGLKSETIRLITEGMRGACSPGGTAGVFFNFTPQVACKTGTAEFNDPKGRTHAWLTAFAPVENPEIVVTALVEAGGEGSTVAAPIVKKVLEEYFRR